MMIRILISSLFLILSNAIYLSAVSPTKPVNFRGGVDYSQSCKDIEPWRACDSSNMIGDVRGWAETRFGSHRMFDTALGTDPVSAFFWTSVTTGARASSVLIAVSGNTIYYSTDDVPTHLLKLYEGLKTPNQRFEFAVFRSQIFMTGEALTDPIFRFDISITSFAPLGLSVSTFTANIYAKHILIVNNYMLAANVRDVRDLPNSTTYYVNRLYYSFALQPSSFTMSRHLEVSIPRGEEISGLTTKRAHEIGQLLVQIYAPNSITALNFTVLDPIAQGGTQKLTQVADGFGHLGRSSPVNLGAWDAMLAREGIVLWNGGLLFRSNLEAEKSVSSVRIRTLIDRLIDAGTYKDSILWHDTKRNYIVFVFEDPNLFPAGILNSVMFYDIPNGEWWPQANWIVGSLANDLGPRGTGRLHYGDGKDGYIHVTDDPIDSDDSRLEISLDPMEKTDGWTNVGISTNVVAVGTASLSLTLTPGVPTSSITKMVILPMGEFYDKTQTTSTGKISFKIWPSSQGFLQTFRIDLELNDVEAAFDQFISSVVISSHSLTAGTSAWTTIEIAMSSFTVLADWIDISSETLPFARNFTRFGIRFVATATADLTLYIDDIRFVQGTKNPLDPFRTTKSLSLGTMKQKQFHEVLIVMERPRDSSFRVDVFDVSGALVQTELVAAKVPKEIFVCGFSSIAGISRISSINFEVLGGTFSSSKDRFDFENGAADPWNVFAYDTQTYQIAKIDRSSFTVFLATSGSLGTGTTNHNQIQEIAADNKRDGIIMAVDHMNHRILVKNKKDLTFKEQFGQLGTGTTSLYNPTGIDFDDREVVIGDDGNQRIAKFTRNWEFVTQAKLDINTIGNLTLKISPAHIFDAYARGSDESVFHTEIILEKRNRGDLKIVKRVIIRPIGRVTSSTDSLRGSLALSGKFVYISFNDGSLDSGKFYIQKLLQSDLSLVDEYSSTLAHFGLIGDNLMRESPERLEKVRLTVPLTENLQFKFYSKGELDSSFRLNKFAVVAEEKAYTVSPLN